MTKTYRAEEVTRMVRFRLVIVYLVLIYVISVKGETLNGKDDHRLHRSKRNVYPCASTNSLKKYQYVSGHTACISASTSLDTTNSGVTASEQTEIVNQHNTHRGNTEATDMNMMSWDNEVAYIAQKWAENCQTNHDAGYKRRIPGRFALGQNLAWSSNKMTWTAAIKLWHDEITDFTYNSDSNVLSKVGHYTQVVWAKSIKIGCGYAKCGSTHLYVCNYGPPGNINIKTPYTQGTKCGSCSGNCLNDLCNCGLVCLNGGTLNLATCTCSCISGFTGTDCSLDCATKTDPSYCVSSYTVSNCPVYSNVPDECPNMCSFCPNSGIAVTGATDGKGVVPFDLTGSGSDTTTVADTGTTNGNRITSTVSVKGSGSDTTTVADTGTTNDTTISWTFHRSEHQDTTTVEPTTMPEESTTISPPPTTTMISTVKPCTNGGLNGTDMVLGQVCGQYGVDCRCTVSHSACMQSQNDTSWKCRCSQGYAKQNQQCVAITTTVEPTTTTVEPCTNGGLNRTDMVIGEVCGQYGVDGRCTVSHSACMQSKTDTSWKCRCSQGYAKQNQQCVAMPIKLFSSGQPVMVTVQESATSGFTIKSINFDEVSGFDVSNPTAEIKGPESSLFTVIASTTDVTLKLGRSLDRLNYVIFVTVSVTIDNVLIRDFVEVRISVSSQGVIGKNIVILHGTPKGSIIGQICTSCITGSDAISVSNSDVYGVNMEGSVATTKPINLDTLQSTMTIFNSTYILVYKNTNLIANVTIIVIRSQYTVTLDEGSVWNTQVALLKNIFHTFEIDTDGLGTSGDVINLGNITLDYEEQTEVTKTLSFSNPTGIMDTLYVLVTIKIQDVNDASPQFQQKPSNKPYNFLAVQSSYKNLIVGVVKAHDPDMSSMLTYNITPSDVLSINKQGVIKADQTIPRSNYTAMVTVSDGLFSDTVAIVVDLLLPTNTNLELNFTGTIDENTNAGAMITNVSVNGYKNYRLTDQAARNDLSLNSVTGLVKSVRPFNRENVQERQFKFTIVGNIENEVSCSLVIIGEITVNVIDVNDEPPVFINTPYTATVVEESSGEQLKMNLPMDTTDKDVNPTVSYSLVNHQDKFDINSLSGIIKTKVNISRETTPSLSISVKADDGVNSATAVIVVTIEDINDNPPYFTSTPYNFAVNESENENSQIGESVGTISANDNDIGKNAEITYQIHSDGGYFRINQTTGEITISRNLDREMNPTHKPIVYARDNGDNILSSSVTVTISVNDINDNAPLFSSDRIMVEFEENKDCSNIITNLTATDSDRPNSENSRITYSLLSGSDDFQIDPSTGSLRCQTMLNYENITSYTLLVKAQDNGSPAKLSSNKTVIINVKDINDNIPTFVDAKNSMIIRYFGIVQRVIEVLNVVDLDYGANGMVTFTISGNAAEFLTINNKGILKTKVSDKPSDGSYSLTITATDMGSPTLNSSHSMNVTVSQHSKPPITFSRQEINMTIMENSNIGVEIGTISTEVNKPSGTTVTFEIIDEKADIKFSLNSDDGKVTLKGSIDREENEFHEFVVRVKNKTNDDQSDLALVTVQILDENDNKPIFDRENFYFEIREDSLSDTPTGVKVIATDADIGMNAEIKYTQLESGGCAAVFTFKENSIVLTGTIDYEVYTFCKLTVKAYNQNNETMSSTVNVHINVLDVNDNSPEFLQHTNNVYTVSVREDTTINTQIPAFGLLKDKDSRENGDIELSTESSCLFDVRRNYDKIQLQVKPSTTLDYESSINVYTCIIKAIDKGAPPLNATATLNISITDVNDNRPQITSPNTNVNVSRDAKVGHVIISQIHATDADSSENGELRYSLQNSQYYSKFIIDPATGRIAINSPLRFVQTDKIILMAIVSDKGIPPLSSAVVVTILITDDNPRPYLEQTPDINIQEHTQRPNDGEIVHVKAYDGVNANGVVKVCNCTFRLDTNRDDLKIDRDGIVRFKNKDDSFDREKEYNSKVFVSVIASDKYDPPKDSDPMIITINIMDINDQYPRFTQDIYHFKVYQKAPNGVQIGTVIAIDKDLAPDTRYSINITESSFSSSVVSINETTGEITKSGDMTLNQTSNTQIKGWVYAQDNKDLSKQPPDSKQITITIEFDDKNNHTPTFQLEKYNTDMQWDAEVKQSIVQTMATDADSGVEGTISYSLVEGNSRGFFKIDNNGVLMLAYKLDSSIGTDATEIVTLTVKAMDGGIIPKYSSVQIIIRISGNNPGACIQGTEHSKQVLDITEERNNWSYAMYALVALLCIAIVCSLFFLYKWRTTPVPTISHPVDKDGKNKYLSSGSDYSDLGKRNTVEYSHSNQGFDPLSMLNPDPYSTVCDNDLHVATSI